MAFPNLAPMTADDLDDYPDGGQPRELINGELSMTPAPSRGHQDLSGCLYRLLYDAAQASNAGKVYYAPVDVRLSVYDVVQPDLVFIARDRLAIWGDGQYIGGAPDLVVEIVSPSSRRSDLVRKAALFAKAGIAEYWTVDSDRRSLTIGVLREGRYEPVAPDAKGRQHSTILPGAMVDPEELFAGMED
jgi:Uma2 family endonuclease